MNKNLHYVAEHTSAASNQGRSIIPRARQPWPTRSHRSACMKSKNDGQDAVYPGRGRAWYSLTVLWLIFMFSNVDRYVISVLVQPIKAELALSDRSEEHTSELQSLMRISYAVFCLKKKIEK